MRRAALVLVLLSLTPSRGFGELTHERQKRVAHIAGALAALRASDQETLTNARNYFYVIERNKCRSAVASLRVNCLLEAARQSCQQESEKKRHACSLIADVIVANRLSEKRFISTRRRYEIMKKHSNYKEMFLKELRRRYAALATELRMSQPAGEVSGDTLAPAIDDYCLHVAGARELSWQSCVAAVVWFIGTSQQ